MDYNISLHPLKQLCTEVRIRVIWWLVNCTRFFFVNSQRKIANEDELIRSIAARHQGNCTVRGVQLDLLSFTDQLRVIGQADVLIGMHGAGLSHVLFMPNHGALIELEPKNAKENTHFADMALWRGLLYRRWRNGNSSFEVRSSRDVIVLYRAEFDNSLISNVLGAQPIGVDWLHRLTTSLSQEM